MSDYCPIGSLNLHTWNYERTECIWCGPNALAWKPGQWVDLGDGLSAWSVEPPENNSHFSTVTLDSRTSNDTL